MKTILFLIMILLGLSAVQAANYQVHKPDEFSPNSLQSKNEKILFILDFSNSMTQYLGGERKVDMMLATINQILPTLKPNQQVGLRVYGQKMGLTQYDACKASTLLVPIGSGKTEEIKYKLSKTNPRGMTPITYSLKKAVESDFLGFEGQKHIILLTDGGENCDESPCTWAMELIKYRHDVKIDVIAFNIDEPEDLDQLECTALVTTGKFYTANTAAQLADSLKKSINPQKQVDAKIMPNP